MYSTELFNFWLSVGILLLQFTTVVMFALFFLRKKFLDLEDIAAFLGKWGLLFAFLLSLGASAMSLFYSEVLGFAPCGLCWLQRVFLYPQVVLFAVALWKRDRGVALYSIALSVIGGIIGLYQHYLQMGGTDVLPCPATRVNAAGITADCAQRFLFEFGYITFPLMSASLFAFLIVLMLFVRRRS